MVFTKVICESKINSMLMHQMPMSTNYVFSELHRLTKLKIRNFIIFKTPKFNAVKCNNIRRRIELCMMEIILHFVMNSSRLILNQFKDIHVVSNLKITFCMSQKCGKMKDYNRKHYRFYRMITHTHWI